MTSTYCSLCGKSIEKCTCRKSQPIETKIVKPEETKIDTVKETTETKK